MASFYIFETVTFPLVLSKQDALQDCKQVVVSLKQGAAQVDKIDPPLDRETGTIILNLSQVDTGRFHQGDVALQVNIYYEDAERDASARATITALDNLYKKVME